MIFHTDIKTGGVLEKILPKNIMPFIRLMRLDRPIGIWLLLWPCLFSLMVSSFNIPSFKFFLLFTFGAIIMRSAGCIINDIYDRNLDKKVKRTSVRPLASGELSVKSAIIFLLFLLLIGAIILFQFNDNTIILGLLSLPLIFIYPLAKRFTNFPQLILGLVFNWGALMGWSAVNGSVESPAVFLYIGCVFWTLGYDTIYAHQDKKDDVMVGIKSLAIHLGDKSIKWISSFYVLFFFFVIISTVLSDMGEKFYYALFVAQIYTIWLISTWKINDESNSLDRFKNNNLLGVLIFHAMLIGRLL